MYVLIREISPYSGPNLFLGLFSDKKKAEDAKEAYLSQVQDKDPWAAQAYKTPKLPEDVLIIEIAFSGTLYNSFQKVYLVSSTVDLMGQISRFHEGVFEDYTSALKFISEKENQLKENDPDIFSINEVLVNLRR